MIACGALLLSTCTASADESSPAQAAYEQGIEAFRLGNFGVACRLLADSYHLEPLPGVLFTWATCELRAARLASAAGHYADFLEAVARLPAAERSAEEERRQVAQRERTRILPELPFLTVVVSANAQRDSTVRRDGAVLPRAALGVETAVDPGEHIIDFVGSDGTHVEQRVVLAKREHKTIVLGFANAPAAAAPAPSVSSAPPRHAETQVSPWVYVTGGVGVAGILTGSIAGLMAMRDKSVVDQECTGAACSQRGKDAADAAKIEATASTVGFGVGVAGLVSSVILYFVDTRPADARAVHPRRWSVVAVSPTPMSVGLGGVF